VHIDKDVEALEEDRIHGQEGGRDQRLGMPGQELLPGQLRPSGIEATGVCIEPHRSHPLVQSLGWEQAVTYDPRGSAGVVRKVGKRGPACVNDSCVYC